MFTDSRPKLQKLQKLQKLYGRRVGVFVKGVPATGKKKKKKNGSYILHLW